MLIELRKNGKKTKENTGKLRYNKIGEESLARKEFAKWKD